MLLLRVTRFTWPSSSHKIKIYITRKSHECYWECHFMVWRGIWGPPFKSGPPSNSGSKVHLPASQYYLRSPETLHMVRWMRNTFEFDQPYKQAQSEMQVQGKIPSDKQDYACVTVGMLRKVIQCKQKRWRWPTRDLHLANCSLTLNKKIF